MRLRAEVFPAKTPEETLALGRRLGKILRGGDVALLSGGLGAGKTTLVKGVAAGAGFRGLVSSPTFALAHRYKARRAAIYHLDLYRVADDESGDIGIEDFAGDPGGICLIEWPQAARAYCPKDALEVSIQAVNHGRRLIFKARGPRGREILREMRKQ